MAEKTALVVGASRGLGLGLAKELAGRGWRVIATRRSPTSDKGLQALADQSGGKVRIETLDLEDRAAIEALPSRLDGQDLDLLFVNAGITGPHGKAGEASEADVGQLFMTNVVGPLHVAETLLPKVKDGDGVIAFMSSGLGSISQTFMPGVTLYSASKAALNRAAMGLVSSLGGKKVTVMLMSPGWVRTDMGGPNAPIGIEDSVPKVLDVIEAKAGSGQHGFYNYDGATIPW
jgi:NAD(P)-dependent dehydrogenase (short-subunit alcohol dehydrogenase family)